MNVTISQRVLFSGQLGFSLKITIRIACLYLRCLQVKFKPQLWEKDKVSLEKLQKR